MLMTATRAYAVTEIHGLKFSGNSQRQVNEVLEQRASVNPQDIY